MIRQPWQHQSFRQGAKRHRTQFDISPLFASQTPLRPLTVLIDASAFELLEEDPQLEFLLGLLANAPVKTSFTKSYPVKSYRFSDAGPPANLPRRQYPDLEPDLVDGWIVRTKPNENDAHGIAYLENGHPRSTWVPWNSSIERAIEATAPPTEYETLGDPIEHMKRDAFAGLAAEALKADIFVSGRSFLFDSPLVLQRAVAVMRPAEAIPVVGLYLRKQGEYINFRTPDGSGTVSFDRGMYYWGAARGLLTESWRWMTACVRHDYSTSNDRLSYLSSSLIQRVERAIQARDRLLVSLCQPQDNNTHDDSLAELDQICLLLMGAIDISAHVANFALNLNEEVQYPKWQHSQWRGRVYDRCPSLVEVLYRNNNWRLPTDSGRVFSILRRLRNTIHGEALSAITYQHRGLPTDTLIDLGLPNDQRQELLEDIDALGGRSDWGISDLGLDRLLANPGLLADQLFPRTIKLLNDLMKESPVERLAGANLTPEDNTAPGESPFDVASRKRILWQLGL